MSSRNSFKNNNDESKYNDNISTREVQSKTMILEVSSADNLTELVYGSDNNKDNNTVTNTNSSKIIEHNDEEEVQEHNILLSDKKGELQKQNSVNSNISVQRPKLNRLSNLLRHISSRRVSTYILYYAILIKNILRIIHILHFVYIAYFSNFLLFINLYPPLYVIHSLYFYI